MIRRRRFKQTATLEHRLEQQARQLREQAKSLPPGIERERKLKLARQTETASHMSEWLRSPGLQSPQ